MWSSNRKKILTLLIICSLQLVCPDLVSSEELSCSKMAAMIEVGTKVVRGKDWVWDNQDGKPGNLGTVIANASTEGWYRVEWDNATTNSYRMGADGKCDLQVVQGTANPDAVTNPVPVSGKEMNCSEMAAMIKVGTKVVRGKDWEWDDQDGKPGNQGTVTANASSEGWYSVEWENGTENSYRMGADGKCDLQVVQETPSPDLVSSEEPSCSEVASKIKVGTTVVRGKDWKWGDQDGSPPTQGTVLSIERKRDWVNVQWESGHAFNYRMGYEDKCDLKIVPGHPELNSTSLPNATASATSIDETSTSLSVNTTSCSTELPTSQLSSSLAPSVDDRSGLSLPADVVEEVGRLTVARAKVLLEAAKSTAQAEASRAEEAILAVETARVSLEAAKSTAQVEATRVKEEAILAVELAKMSLEAARLVVKAEGSWAMNAAEDLEFEREHRKQISKEFHERNTTISSITE